MIRPIEGRDFKGVIELWKKALPEHSIDERLFYKNVLLDMNFDPQGFLVLERAGKIVGFSWAIARRFPVDVGAPAQEDKGYLNLFVLEDEEDESGEELLKAQENYLKLKGIKKISVSGYTPNYIYPGINSRRTQHIRLLEKFGYVEQKRNYSISINLKDFEKNESIEELERARAAEGFTVEPLSEEYVIQMLDYAPPGWTHRIRRLINETLDLGRVLVVVKDKRVIGCALFGDPYSSDERFGPYKVDEEYRGLGLGKILLYRTLMTMKERGLGRAWAQSTPSSGAAKGVYEKMGFVHTAEFITFLKEL